MLALENATKKKKKKKTSSYDSSVDVLSLLGGKSRGDSVPGASGS